MSPGEEPEPVVYGDFDSFYGGPGPSVGHRVAKESEPSIESEDQEEYGESETSTYTSESEDSRGSNDFPPPPSARKYGTAAKISMHNTSAKSNDTRRAHPTQAQKRSTKAKTTEGTSRSRKGSQQERVTVSDQDSESDDDERKTPSIEEVKGISKAAKVQATKDASKLKSQPREKRAAKKKRCIPRQESSEWIAQPGGEGEEAEDD